MMLKGGGGICIVLLAEKKQDYNRTEADRCQGNGLFSRHQG